MSEKTENIKNLALEAIDDETILETTLDQLRGTSRRQRQTAAAVVSQVSAIKPEALAGCIEDIIEALDRPEAQTRWESLDALTNLVAIDSRACDKAFPGAEEALFDEDNGMVRLAAVRFLCRIGSTTELRSEKAWTLLDEAIQCYHGDYEYPDMLVALISFAGGKLQPEVREGLKARVAFDAENGRGALQRRSQQVIEALA